MLEDDMLDLPTPRPHGKPDLRLHDRALSEVFESIQAHHLRALSRLTTPPLLTAWQGKNINSLNSPTTTITTALYTTHLSYIGTTDTAPSSMRVRMPFSMSVREHRGRNKMGPGILESPALSGGVLGWGEIG